MRGKPLCLKFWRRRNSKTIMKPLHLFAALLASFMLSAAGSVHASSSLLAEQEPPQWSATAPDATPDRTPQGLEKLDWFSIRAAHTAWQHSIQRVEGERTKWRARNAGRWTARFDGRGFLATPQAAEWQWGLQLVRYGFGESQTTVTGEPQVKTDGARLTYLWDQRLEEWFLNDTHGLEHGFVLKKRPAGIEDGLPLEVVLAVRGGLRPAVSADGQTVYFRSGPGASVVTYGGLKVWDADGHMRPFSLCPERKPCGGPPSRRKGRPLPAHHRSHRPAGLPEGKQRRGRRQVRLFGGSFWRYSRRRGSQ